MPNTLIYPNFPKRKTKRNDKTKKGVEITNVVQHLTASAISVVFEQILESRVFFKHISKSKSVVRIAVSFKKLTLFTVV